jgi:enoyl-CoA hydratase/carnithine racemase
VPPFSLDDLNKALVDPEPGAGLVDVLGGGAVVVDLGAGGPPHPRLRSLVAVLVGVGSDDHPHAAGFDVVVADEAGAAEVVAAVAANPIAATSCALLLRTSEELDVDGALVAESSTYSLLQAGPEHQAWLRGRAPRTRARDDGDTPVSTQREGGRLRLTLQRPHVRNAFDAATRDALLAGLAVAAVDDSVDEVVVDGDGPGFCSGGDLDEFGTAADPATAHLVRLSRSVGRAVDQLRDRVTFVVHGACIGAGVELAAFAGRVVARPDATFRLPEVGMGLVPGAGGTVSIPRRIGRRPAGWLALTGATINAGTALDLGLVDTISSTEGARRG